jgi:abnormal spindle-like microcephaly-associated protein
VFNVKYCLCIADVITTQSVVRRHLSIKLAAQKTLSIVVIQKLARKWLACNYVASVRDTRGREERAAIAIQSVFRAGRARSSLREKHRSTILLQTAFRRHLAVRSFAAMRLHVTIVQTVARRRHATLHCAKRRASILTIQVAFRRRRACELVRRLKKERKEKISRNQAALKVQSCARRFLVRYTMSVLHRRATLVQAAFRAHFARRCYEMDVMDIRLAQSVVRRWLACKSLLLQRQAATTIQKTARKKQAITFSSVLRSEKQCEHMESRSAIKIQSFWRGQVSRSLFRKLAAARKIQKTWRCFNAHVDFLIQVMSVISIQSRVRQFLTKRAIESAKRAVVKLQARVRGRIQQKRRLTAISSARNIQTLFRAYAARESFATKIKSAILIQKWTRGHICRADLAVLNFAACEIQRIWRGCSQFIDFAFMVISIVKIQAVARKFVAKRRFDTLKRVAWAEKRFLNKKASIIQLNFRSFAHRKKLGNAAARIQAFSRQFLRERKLRKVKKGVIQFQACTRAIAVRRKRPKKLVVLASRVIRANERSVKDPKMRLGYRTTNALTILQTSTRLAEIMAAVKTLEASTRLSVGCCEVFTRVNAAHILLNLIAGCNRSVPHVELVHFTLLTLDNVAQHARLLPNFADCGTAEIFLDKMLMFRDNDSIFCLSVSLLGRIAGCNPAVMVRLSVVLQIWGKTVISSLHFSCIYYDDRSSVVCTST